jgi:hypothetical protein
MVIRFLKSFLVLGAVLFSQSSYALVDAQVLLGRRQMNLDIGKENKLSGSEIRLALHLDPIPLVPVAFGLSYGMISSNAKANFTLATANDYKVTETTGYELALEIMVWSPIDLFNITPYLKAGYIPYGAYTFAGTYDLAGTSTDLDLLYGSSGSLVSFGLKWAPLPLVGLLFEAQNTISKLSFDKLEEAAGSNLPVSSPSASMKSWSYMIGLEVGI